MPAKGTSILIKKALGTILALIGIGLFLKSDLILKWGWWNESLAVVLFVSAFFLLIAGRQLE